MAFRQFAVYRRYIDLIQLLSVEINGFPGTVPFFDFDDLPFSIAVFFDPKVIPAAFNGIIVVVDY